MLKGIKSGLNHMNPKNIHFPHRSSSKGANDADNAEGEGNGAPPPGVPVGPRAMPPPGLIPGKLPPGAIVKGAPPPGAKIIKGPPPGDGMKVMSGGVGFVSVPHPGAGSPMGNSTTSPHPGMKVMAHPPPGAKLINGAPPPGMKIMQGSPLSGAKMMQGASPPPGAKIIQGAPPPWAKVMQGSPPPGAIRTPSPSSVSPGGATPPPHAGLVKTPMRAPPPGAKLIHGPPPPGSRPISPENARRLSGSPSLVPSRPLSPSGMPVYRVLPNGVKVLAGPPPAGTPVKIMSKSPVPAPTSGTTSPGPPVKSPPRKMLIKTLVPNGYPSGHPNPPSPTTSQLIPQNASFSVGPPASGSSAQEGLPRPTPVRPSGVVVTADQASSNGTGTPLQVPHPNLNTSSSIATQELQFEEELNSDGGDIMFEETSSAAPPPAPRASPPPPSVQKAHSETGDSSSSSSSFSINEDADEVTALPPAFRGKPGVASSAASVRSSHRATTASESKLPVRDGAASESGHGSTGQATERRVHRSRRSSTAASEATKERGRHRHHHRHRTHSTSASSEQSYQVPLPEAPPRAREVTAVGSATDNSRGRSSSSPQQQLAVVKRHASMSPPPPSGSGQLSDAAFTPQALTSSARNRIAEDFLSMLCPQQYYGKVKKINRIRPFKANRSAATGLGKGNSIYVATKGTMPNPYFYPQLRLRDLDGEQPSGLTGDETGDGAVDTPIILYEASPGNMLFAETELDARRLLDGSPGANSCFMLSNSAILFKDPEHYVLPIASLNVQWVPYASPQSEPQCPVHKRELQLFDPYSKELVCALCASRNGVPMANFVVIPDVLGNADSRHTIQEKVSAQLEDAQQSARRWVEQHQRIRELCDNKKSAIRNQFDLLIEALEAKKLEYMEACDAEFAYAQTDVAREILITDEKSQLLRAASDHLRTDPTRPLFSMQIATIAEGLSAATDLPSRFTRNSLQLPPMSAGLMPNLEGVMARVLELSPSNTAAAKGNGASNGGIRSGSASHSPFNSRRTGVPFVPDQGMEDMVQMTARRSSRRRTGGSQSVSIPFTVRPNTRSTSASQSYGSPLRKMARALPTSPSSARAPSSQAREETSYVSSSSQMRSANGNGSPSKYATDAVSVPNSTGTSLFDFALHDLLTNFDSSNVKRRSPRYIQWAIRVEDPGDWVGLGVGVGNTIDAWEQGSTNDLSHLWIVPASMTGQVLYLRVTVLSSSGHAKLSVHDGRGKQLDVGEIPQWNAMRPSYPQATFGGNVGTVRMIEVPHGVR